MSTEGKAPFTIPGIQSQCSTWYKVFGSLTDTSKTPLILLHGGPAGGHEYFLPLHDLVDTVIVYDQLGCGASPAPAEMLRDEHKSLWTVDLFCRELDNLLAHLGLAERDIDIMGHSWGGMLAVAWATSDPLHAKHLRHLIVYSCPADLRTHSSRGLEPLKATLSVPAQEAIRHALESKEYESEAYAAARKEFGERYVNLSRPFPHPLLVKGFVQMAGSVVHDTLYGPTMFEPSGCLFDFSSVPVLHRITAPTLLIRGSEDYVVDEAVQPLFDGISKVKWITFDGAAHFAHVEQAERFVRLVRQFLAS